MIPWYATIVGAIAIVALLQAARAGSPVQRPLKMLASTSFVAVAVSVDAFDTAFGRFVLGALVFAWLGDLFLSYGGRTAFLAGLGAFLFTHVLYSVGFIARDVQAPHPVEPVAIAVLGLLVARWLLPFVAGPMRGPVLGYLVAVSVMVILAGASAEADPDSRLRLGAIAFYVSDIMVARDRFVAPGFTNRAVGLPLYYVGQFLLAWSSGA